MKQPKKRPYAYRGRARCSRLGVVGQVTITGKSAQWRRAALLLRTRASRRGLLYSTRRARRYSRCDGTTRRWRAGAIVDNPLAQLFLTPRQQIPPARFLRRALEFWHCRRTGEQFRCTRARENISLTRSQFSRSRLAASLLISVSNEVADRLQFCYWRIDPRLRLLASCVWGLFCFVLGPFGACGRVARSA